MSEIEDNSISEAHEIVHEKEYVWKTKDNTNSSKARENNAYYKVGSVNGGMLKLSGSPRQWRISKTFVYSPKFRIACEIELFKVLLEQWEIDDPITYDKYMRELYTFDNTQPGQYNHELYQNELEVLKKSKIPKENTLPKLMYEDLKSMKFIVTKAKRTQKNKSSGKRVAKTLGEKYLEATKNDQVLDVSGIDEKGCHSKIITRPTGDKNRKIGPVKCHIVSSTKERFDLACQLLSKEIGADFTHHIVANAILWIEKPAAPPVAVNEPSADRVKSSVKETSESKTELKQKMSKALRK